MPTTLIDEVVVVVESVVSTRSISEALRHPQNDARNGNVLFVP